MHLRTVASLDELEEVNWFRNVAKPAPVGVSLVCSWKGAVESCATLDWENLCLERANDYRAIIHRKSWERLSKWNEIVVEVKKRSIPLVRRKIASVAIDHELPKVFVDTVEWDILHIAMTAEFADVATSDFYAEQHRWYLEGRFPCGWDGAFPDGRFVVY